MRCEVPVWEKANLTLEEAAAYSGIGINKLRELSDSDDCKFVLWVGRNAVRWSNILNRHIPFNLKCGAQYGTISPSY